MPNSEPGTRRIRIALRFRRARAFATCTSPSIDLVLTTGLPAALDKIAGKPADAPEVATVADPFMFQDYYAERAPDQIAKEFGPDFAKAVFRLKPGAWQGPIRSGYGWHLVFVDAIEPGRVPAFEEVEPDVKSAWLDQKQREIKRIAFEAMRARYTVVVPPIESVDLGEPAESCRRQSRRPSVFPQ